jgi:hypothetical protein
MIFSKTGSTFGIMRSCLAIAACGRVAVWVIIAKRRKIPRTRTNGDANAVKNQDRGISSSMRVRRSHRSRARVGEIGESIVGIRAIAHAPAVGPTSEMVTLSNASAWR